MLKCCGTILWGWNQLKMQCNFVEWHLAELHLTEWNASSLLIEKSTWVEHCLAIICWYVMKKERFIRLYHCFKWKWLMLHRTHAFRELSYLRTSITKSYKRISHQKYREMIFFFFYFIFLIVQNIQESFFVLIFNECHLAITWDVNGIYTVINFSSFFFWWSVIDWHNS